MKSKYFGVGWVNAMSERPLPSDGSNKDADGHANPLPADKAALDNGIACQVQTKRPTLGW